jgi:hypothetical protein
MSRLVRASHQRVVADLSEIEQPAMTKLLGELIAVLGFEIVVEETPDYTAYELRRRP